MIKILKIDSLSYRPGWDVTIHSLTSTLGIIRAMKII